MLFGMNTELAYLAGYIDGDGCFYIGKNIKPVKYRSGIIISSTQKEVLRFFKKTFNGNIIFDKRNPKFKNWSPVSQWYTGGEHALLLLDKIVPFLHEKLHDAEMMKKFILAQSKKEKDNFIIQTKEYRNKCNLVTSQEVERINQLRRVPYTENDLAYMAGFIDSECSISLSRYCNSKKPHFLYKALLQCNNTKTGTVEYLKSKFGGCCYLVPRSKKNPLHKDQIAWRISSKTFTDILPLIFPYLKTKQPICELLIQYSSTIMKIGGDRHTHLSYYSKTLEIRDQIFHKIALLNSKTNT